MDEQSLAWSASHESSAVKKYQTSRQGAVLGILRTVDRNLELRQMRCMWSKCEHSEIWTFLVWQASTLLRSCYGNFLRPIFTNQQTHFMHHWNPSSDSCYQKVGQKPPHPLGDILAYRWDNLHPHTINPCSCLCYQKVGQKCPTPLGIPNSHYTCGTTLTHILQIHTVIPPVQVSSSVYHLCQLFKIFISTEAENTGSWYRWKGYRQPFHNTHKYPCYQYNITCYGT